ncbi:DUF4440 domain-containing protein [Photobacterium sp. MCCC 1A19761]|uniref:nuclear transport factor 2 family protein n=1 Tax=Photobacterium sp. MCCC 1A19761 TaxID=3115000 RepID=UPI00307EC70A
MDLLIEQEIALHQFDIRQNMAEVTRLIHPDFREVGRSGTSFDFTAMLDMMASEQAPNGYVHSQDFETMKLEERVFLLLYKSAWIDDAGNARHFAKRSSIWSFDGEKWQLKYHQGTPCAEFQLQKIT